MTSATTMTANAISSLRERTASVAFGSATRCTSRAPSEQARRADQQHDRHDDEDHSVGGLGKEHLGQPLDDAQSESGDNGAHDRAPAADHHHREHNDEQ